MSCCGESIDINGSVICALLEAFPASGPAPVGVQEFLAFHAGSCQRRHEALTVVSYDPDTMILTYTDEAGDNHQVNIGYLVPTLGSLPTGALGMRRFVLDTMTWWFHNGVAWFQQTIPTIYPAASPPTGAMLHEGALGVETTNDRLMAVDGAGVLQRTGWYSSTGRTGCTANRASNQSIANNTVTQITFTSEAFDSDGFFAPTSGNFTIPAGLGGLYLIEAHFQWSGAATAGFSSVSIGGSRIKSEGSTDPLTGCSFMGRFTPGQVVGLLVYQVTGGPLNVNPAEFNIYRIGL